ncbi:hypothetical protein GGR51DRAFT_573439 [Nemania sp. FL0031]|nr:hypothetical protein GGR51DRAFT_573439 [Nemania sp. FL0031]
MHSRSIPSSQAHSQPVLPSQRSHYFGNGVVDHLAPQSQGRLSPLPPRLYRPPVGIPSPRRPMLPFQHRQQPHPFFHRGPAAMGYIPQQPMRYPRSFGPREPIVPMRNESPTASSVHGGQRSMALHRLEQSRPYSVPSQYMQTSQVDSEHFVSTIPRPISIAHTDTRRLFESDHPNLNPLPESNAEELGLSSCKRSVPEDSSVNDELIPPKRTLPFPSSKQTKEQLEGTNGNTSPLNSALTPAQQVNQCATDEATETSTTQLRSSKRLADKKKEISKRRTKIRLVSRSVDLLESSSKQEYSTSMSAPSRVNEDVSRGSEHYQMPKGRLNGDGISESLNPTHQTSDVNESCTSPQRTSELTQLYPNNTSQDSQAKNSLVAPDFIPEDLNPCLIDPSLSSPHDRNYKPGITQDSVPRTVLPNVPTHTIAKRSLSQATTMSSTSTELSHTGEDKDSIEVKELFNPMSIIDETMILERDISEIVSARLQEGNADSLETLQGEILIKMAVKDDEIFEAVSRMLQL